MKTKNKITLVGIVDRDPIVRKTSGTDKMGEEKEVVNFTLYTVEHWITRDRTKVTKKEYHRVCVFVPWIVNFIKKNVRAGDALYIEGSVHTRLWKGSQDEKRSVTEVVLQSNSSSLLKLEHVGQQQKIEHDSEEDDDIIDF
ncbi:single-stranded DNA-binding protein [Candidatus Fokinia crypta]|uniref:Single-stranded DNA-binding protein n=1 Tax=Candidatus Fokinia crypta TaxID=1920990 RepID=A0ABZ0UPU5_9RICK|nr:single-stranded DNA-binding protein [Candidatus Fokinia cryptica]WPX97562.1 Single-stranded DNA-binding protein [Candidatus Fokinia cryptica]